MKQKNNVRPTYLLVELKSEGVSSRKLVLETVLKRNVLLANSTDEAQMTLHVFPNVDGVIIHASVPEASTLVSWIHQQYPKKYIVFLGDPASRSCKGADAVISGHDPVQYLTALQAAFDTSGAIRARKKLLVDLKRTLRKP